MEWLDTSPLFATANVDFGGIRRVVNMACVPESSVGDYVLVHAGIAISLIDQHEAERLWMDFEALGIANSTAETEGSEPQ